jgi:hypothetical protein
MKVTRLARILPVAVLACLVSASAAHSASVPDTPEGRWTGTLQCTRSALSCVDMPVVLQITPDGHDLSYTAKISYGAGDSQATGPAITFVMKPELHTLTAHYTDFTDRQFWALRLDGDSLGGVRLVNDHYIDRYVYLTRDRQP